MNPKKYIIIPLLCGLGICLQMSLPAHEHIAAGISDINGNELPDAGEPLAIVGPTGTAKIRNLLPRPAGQLCGGYYMLDEKPRSLFPNDGYSFIALSEYDDLCAHKGSWIWIEILTVTGPEGGQFGYWEENHSLYFNTPTRTFEANQPTQNFSFVLSEGINAAGEDPYGHIHNRSWTANKAGDYFMTFRIVDRSTNGPSGGPWHTPSVPYTYHFKAHPEFQPKILKKLTGEIELTWPSKMGIWEPYETGMVFKVWRSPNLIPGTWIDIGQSTGTSAANASFLDMDPLPQQAFYKITFDWSSSP